MKQKAFGSDEEEEFDALEKILGGASLDQADQFWRTGAAITGGLRMAGGRGATVEEELEKEDEEEKPEEKPKEKKDPLQLITKENVSQKAAAMIGYCQKKVTQLDSMDTSQKKLYTKEIKGVTADNKAKIEKIISQLKAFATRKNTNVDECKKVVKRAYGHCADAQKHMAMVKQLA